MFLGRRTATVKLYLSKSTERYSLDLPACFAQKEVNSGKRITSLCFRVGNAFARSNLQAEVRRSSGSRAVNNWDVRASSSPPSISPASSFFALSCKHFRRYRIQCRLCKKNNTVLGSYTSFVDCGACVIETLGACSETRSCATGNRAFHVQ